LGLRRQAEAPVILHRDALRERGQRARERLLLGVVVQAQVRRLDHRPVELLVVHLVLAERLGAGGRRGEQERAQCERGNADPRATPGAAARGRGTLPSTAAGRSEALKESLHPGSEKGVAQRAARPGARSTSSSVYQPGSAVVTNRTPARAPW